MKVDTRNPQHWLWLAASGLWATIAVLLRLFRRRHRQKVVLLYGHKLGGNLLSLYRHLEDDQEFEVAFLSLDPAYAAALTSDGKSAVSAVSWRCIRWLADADALVSDHGLHSLELLLHLSNIRFFDTWHGIPFKGFDGDDFRVQHRYDEVWVASSTQRDLYVEKFGFDTGIVHATGYARTDRLVHRNDDVDAIKSSLGLDPATCGKVFLFAPTWKQDAGERSLFPFGVEAKMFLAAMSGFAKHSGATVLLRTHLNSGEQANFIPERVVPLPYALFPDTESILLASDVLVCDWSSIAFDFLLLDRPALFLDVPAPFEKGFSLGPDFRYGAIISSLDHLLATMESVLLGADAYWERHGEGHSRIRDLVYAGYDDGGSAQRCLLRLSDCLARDGSFRSRR